MITDSLTPRITLLALHVARTNDHLSSQRELPDAVRITADCVVTSDVLWREIEGWPEYHISDYGNVRRATPNKGTRAGKHCKPLLNKTTGYYGIALCRNSVQKRIDIHRLVAFAFLGPQPSPRHLVAHNDGVRTNNIASNLRWATQRENLSDMHRHGTALMGMANPMAKLDEIDISAIHQMKALGIPRSVISEGLGVHKRTIFRVLESGVKGAGR